MFINAGRRCAFDFNELKLPSELSKAKALQILNQRGYYKVDVTFDSIVNVLREYVGISTYRRGSSIQSAPEVVDCSTLTKWAYKLRGIRIPRYSIAQHTFFPIEVEISKMRAGDLVFTTGRINYFHLDPNYGIGHVGFATNEGTVIHAADKKQGVIESKLNDFVKEFRGIRRLVLDDSNITTIESPADSVVEDSDQFRWMILQQCEK